MTYLLGTLKYLTKYKHGLLYLSTSDMLTVFLNLQVELQSLAKMKEELASGQEKLNLALQTLDHEMEELRNICSGLEEEHSKLQKTLKTLEEAGEMVNPDEVTI